MPLFPVQCRRTKIGIWNVGKGKKLKKNPQREIYWKKKIQENNSIGKWPKVILKWYKKTCAIKKLRRIHPIRVICHV